MRIVSVFSSTTSEVLGRHFAFAICFATSVDVVSSLSAPSLSLSLSLSRSLLYECRWRRANFTFAQISFINIPREGLQIECLIAMKLHLDVSGNICMQRSILDGGGKPIKRANDNC